MGIAYLGECNVRLNGLAEQQHIVMPDIVPFLVYNETGTELRFENPNIRSTKRAHEANTIVTRDPKTIDRLVQGARRSCIQLVYTGDNREPAAIKAASARGIMLEYPHTSPQETVRGWVTSFCLNMANTSGLALPAVTLTRRRNEGVRVALTYNRDLQYRFQAVLDDMKDRMDYGPRHESTPDETRIPAMGMTIFDVHGSPARAIAIVRSLGPVLIGRIQRCRIAVFGKKAGGDAALTDIATIASGTSIQPAFAGVTDGAEEREEEWSNT